jgi:hypothetical protein
VSTSSSWSVSQSAISILILGHSQEWQIGNRGATHWHKAVVKTSIMMATSELEEASRWLRSTSKVQLQLSTLHSVLSKPGGPGLSERHSVGLIILAGSRRWTRRSSSRQFPRAAAALGTGLFYRFSSRDISPLGSEESFYGGHAANLKREAHGSKTSPGYRGHVTGD